MINIRALKNIARLKKYPQNTVISAGMENRELVVVLKGEAGIYSNYGKPDEERTATVGSGDFFGEAALLPEGGEPFTAVALDDVIALPIAGSSAASFIREEPEMSLELMKAMSARLHPECIAAPAAVPPGPAAGENAAPHRADFPLFPEGHGSYRLELNNGDRTYLMDKSHTCPYCKKEFGTLQVRTSKLVMDSTDADMRQRYKGIEPLYYDVVTCPHCLYSALAESFGHPDILKADLKELEALKSGTGAAFGANIDAFSVFAGYYLALLCAPKCFTAHRMATAKLLLKLSRIYQDCGDSRMEEAAAQKALDAYLYIYMNEKCDLAMEQQLCIIIGELYLKLNDRKNARDFFFKAKTNREGSPLLKTQAENRIMNLRTMEG